MSIDTQTPTRRPIRQLTTSVINKIAAGEVIERPASAVKELLENSIDAGADRIEVAIENGGLDLIRITDNGCGIAHDQLLLAVASHATSKINDADDLFRVGTFGFRGEALASIAEISQFTLRSRTADSDAAYELIVNGGHAEPVEPCGAPQGTTIEIRNLFYNTPVRRKFLRSAQTEMGHIAEAFTRIALAYPQRQLTLMHNGRVIYQLAPTSDWAQRIGDFFGPEVADGLIPVSGEFEQVRLSGFVVDPAVNRSNNRMQYLFLNQRYIRDRSLQHALSEAYRGLLMTGKFPICFLRLEMPYDWVDVNVHPAKLEVRFQDGGRVYSQLLSTIRNKFLSTDLTAKGGLGGPQQNSTPDPLPSPFPVSPFGRDLSSLYSRGGLGPTNLVGSIPTNASGNDTGTHQSALAFPVPTPRDWVQQPLASQSSTMSPESVLGSTPNTVGAGWESRPLPPQFDHVEPSSQQSQRASLSNSGLESFSSSRMTAIQVFNTYLITETDEGLVIIDQHALHERVMYEQLRQKIYAGTLQVQSLLVPEPVTLPPADRAVVIEHAATLRQVGLAVEPFGGDTVLVTAYPAMLAHHNPADMLRTVVEALMTEGAKPQERDLLDDLLHMIACKAAIKSGDRLTRDEIQALLEHREYCRDAHHCPHGRPTALVFSREELDKRFKRI